MAIQELDFWYDGQIRRFLNQIVRAFSGFQYQTGYNASGAPQLVMVPCRMDLRDRVVAFILRNNSENTMLSVPMITVAMTGLSGRREDVQNPSHIDTRQVWERAIANGVYLGTSGNRYTVERVMPRPFTLEVQVDIWTSNLEQKHQLMEQILTVIYPAFTIQNSDNPLDWSARTNIEVEDITWSSRSIPVNADEIEIATIRLKMPFWLSPPAKVTQQRIIEQIIANVRGGTAPQIEEVVANIDQGQSSINDMSNAALLSQQVVTPGDHYVSIQNGVITLLGPGGIVDDPTTGQPYQWEPLLEQYGTLRPTLSLFNLKTGGVEDANEIVGSLQMSSNATQLLWTVEPSTLPTNTLSPVDAYIDPRRVFPGNGLPAVLGGQRYLLDADIGPCQAWGNLTARANDIIEYQNASWSVVFQAATANTTQYCVNLYSGKQLRWDGTEWVLAVDGVYAPGFWSLSL